MADNVGLAANHRLGRPLPQRIAVFRALQLGDMLSAVPALRALRAALPVARITLVGLPWAAAFARRFAHYVDDFLAFPGAPGLPERVARPNEALAFSRAARRRAFDMGLQLHDNGYHSNAVVLGLGAGRAAGFFCPGDPCPDAQRFLRYPEDLPEWQRLLALTTFLGIPPQGDGLEFPLTAADRAAQAPLAVALSGGDYACIHPGARAAARRWPATRFAQVGDALAGHGLRVVVTGAAAEADLAATVAAAMTAPSLNAAGQTTLDGLAALLAGARLVVCNDTGIAHIAAALNRPRVVIYTASDPLRWAPPDPTSHRGVYHPITCRPCDNAICPIGHPCATAVDAGEVIEQAMELLSESTSTA